MGVMGPIGLMRSCADRQSEAKIINNSLFGEASYDRQSRE